MAVVLSEILKYEILVNVAHCATSNRHDGKMRPLQFGFYNNRNCYRKPKSTKKFTFHDVLLSYQPTSTADSAHLGWIGWADLVVAQKDIVESEIFC